MIDQKHQLEQMKEKLRDTIKGIGYLPEIFQVFAWEAGLGKSKFSTQYIAECIEDSILNKDQIPKFLVVKKFKSDVENTVKALKDSNAYALYGVDTVVGITSENWQNWRKKLQKLESCLVLVITHQRYIELCGNELQAPFGNRDTLLIDEKIEFPIYNFSKGNYDKVRATLLHSLQKELDKVTSPLLDKLEMYQLGKTNEIIVDSVTFDVSKLKGFRKLIEENKESIKGNLNDLLNFIEELGFFYNKEIFYNSGKYFGVNPMMKLRMLRNNIILDASATVDSIYKGEKFKIVESKRIIDYERCTFTVENRNSSRSTVKRMETQYLTDATRFVKKTYNNSDKKCLYICHKSEAEKLLKTINNIGLSGLNVHIPKKDEEVEMVNSRFAINWFGNIVGQNIYSNFDIVYIIATNNLPYPVYFLQYAIYNGFEKIMYMNFKLKKGKFVDDFIEKIRIGFIAADFYQAAKRIQRNETPKGHFIIVNNNEEITSIVQEQFKNIQPLTIDRYLEPGPENKQKAMTLDIKLINYLKELNVGVYKKAEIAEKIGTKTHNLSRLWKSKQIQSFIRTEYIKVEHHDIKILKKLTF